MKRLTKFALSVFVVALILDLSFLFADINADMDIIPAVSAAEIVQSGSCGTNVTYTLDSEGTLTISGTGAMKDYYSYSSCPWYSSRESIKKVIISDGVTSIGNYAFYSCSSLQSVTIPDSVTSIGYEAFRGCSSLQSVTIPDSVTSIGYDAFYICSSLQSVYIEDLVKWFAIDFGNYASNPLYYTADLYLNGEKVTDVTFPAGTTAIGKQLSGCTSLVNVTIPDSVTSIGSSAFYSCSSLQSVYIEDLVKWFAIDFGNSYSNPLYNTADLYLNGEKVTDVTFPAGTTEIGMQLSGCTSLVNVTIPDSVTSIGYEAFYNCSSLQSVTIPDSVTSIGGYAFEYCSSLQSVTIPDSVTNIGSDAFDDCSSLRCVIFGGTSEQWSNITIGSWNYPLTGAKRYCLGDGYVADGKNILNQSKTLLIYHYSPEKIYTVPSGIKSIEQNAFSDSKNLSAVILPEGLKNIGSYAFSGGNLSSIYIPVSVSTIDQYVFNNCSRLSDVYFGGTEEQFKSISIGNYNTYLKNATIHYNTKLIELDGAIYTEDMKTLVAVSNQKEGAFTIPSTVTTINSYAFSDCGKITEILIPETVTVIGNSAFRNCDGISEITLPVGITKLNNYVLYDCDNLQSITIPDNVTSIGEYAFYGCENLKTGSFNSALLSVGSYAFYGCKELQKLSLPEKLTAIGNYAFSGCSKLSEIYFPSSLTAIGSYAFSENSALTYVSLPDSVNSLGTYVFYKCMNLEKIGLPEGILSSVPANAFNGCQKLTSIFIPENIAAFGDSAFYGCNNLSDIYYGDTEAEWDKISIVSSNSVIWAANVHFEHSHTNSNWQAIIEPGSDIIWLKASICDVCGYEKRAELEIKHTGYAVDAVTPTCLDIGYTAGVYCTECEDYISGHEEIEALGHDEVKHTAKAPTCTEIGWDAYVTCSRCDYTTYVEKAINADAHKWDDGAITTTATCKVNGVKTYTCQHDATHKKTENLGVNTSNHVNTKNTEAVASTCSAVGYTAGVYCNDCQKYISGHNEIAIDANAHKWDNGAITTTATCKVNGVKTYTCQHNSEHTKTVNLGVNISNHVNTKNVAEEKATCTTKGSTAGVYCNDCEKYVSGHTEIPVDTNAHKWDNGTITTTATCKVSGVKTYTCQHNASHKKTENLGVNASNHINTKNTEAVASTCSTVGYTAGVYCNDCQKYISGHKETPVNANAHKWDNGKITTTATCKVSGVKTYTCQHNSAHKKTEGLGVNASNHVNTKNVAEVKATCTTKGYTAGVYCNDCQKYISGHTEIPVDTNAHKWDNGTVTTTATCKVSGVKTYTCQHNSAHKKTENLGVNASNHVNTKNVAEVKATCTTKGSTAGVYCNDCQKYISGHKENAINPSNHVNTKTVPATPATFDKVGYTEGVFCNDCQKYISGHKEIPVLMNIGDVDGNGKIDATDARLALRAAVGLETLSVSQKKTSDVDFDGQVTSSDARLILRAAVGLEELKKRNK